MLLFNLFSILFFLDSFSETFSTDIHGHVQIVTN